HGPDAPGQRPAGQPARSGNREYATSLFTSAWSMTGRPKEGEQAGTNAIRHCRQLRPWSPTWVDRTGFASSPLRDAVNGGNLGGGRGRVNRICDMHAGKCGRCPLRPARVVAVSAALDLSA